MEKKQERKVIHLELEGEHFYYGSIAQLFEDYNEQELGISYYTTKNNLKAKGIIITPKCTIRQGVLRAKEKKS